MYNQIVDSIIALYRVDFCGRGELSDRQQKLGQMMSRLVKIAEEFNVAVFITNQVQSDPSGMSFGGAGKLRDCASLLSSFLPFHDNYCPIS